MLLKEQNEISYDQHVQLDVRKGLIGQMPVSHRKKSMKSLLIYSTLSLHYSRIISWDYHVTTTLSYSQKTTPRLFSFYESLLISKS